MGNKPRRSLRKRSILTILPMAMIAMASPGRTLQFGRGGTSLRRSERACDVAQLVSGNLLARSTANIIGASSRRMLHHQRRVENKVRHVVHSDNFSHEDCSSMRSNGGRRKGRFWSEILLSRGSSSAVMAAAAPPMGFRQRTRMLKRNIMEMAVRGVQFRNKFQWKLGRSNSFADMNRYDKISARNTVNSAAANRNGMRVSLRPLINLFDRSPKVAMETMDTMVVGEMSAVEHSKYSRAMSVLSTNAPASNQATKVTTKRNEKRNLLRFNLLKNKSTKADISSRGGAITATMPSSSASQTIQKSTYTSSPSSISSSPSHSLTESSDTWIIETPLFPIILPKSWEPSTATTAPIQHESISTTEIMEISVAIEQQEAILSKPSLQTLQLATRPLISKSAWATFQGNEFYYPETMELLSQTGLRMALEDNIVNWVGEKKTTKFLQDHSDSLTEALASSQEVLAWSGKFSSDGHGSELPVIKTMAVVNKSPEYLADLLMDSSKVKAYNKMSLGRSDEEVFQSGINTVGGSFGDGESKVVRNLTKPPMVKSILEFVTCMHARKLRHGDSSKEPLDGYIVVSRAVTGGKWAPKDNTGENYVRNEILLGVNLLKAIPDEPDKTELTAVTHVYSPMVPVMLAKSAGMKGAVDFVRDIRALS